MNENFHVNTFEVKKLLKKKSKKRLKIAEEGGPG